MDPWITTLLPLDGWEVTTVADTATGRQVTVAAPRPAECPIAGTRGGIAMTRSQPGRCRTCGSASAR